MREKEIMIIGPFRNGMCWKTFRQDLLDGAVGFLWE